MYWLRLFGRPGHDRVWAWRFGGHHISLNYLVIDGRLVAATPCFGLNELAAHRQRAFPR
ncbi:DUF3500 domain-containing protein [Nocardia sp. bgisy118]|uniref:DUF3500 domain-containing protein n=1 Tax=Nocardia sp. bgisy118 TaxID=3413786 RepID=UPI003F49C047